MISDLVSDVIMVAKGMKQQYNNYNIDNNNNNGEEQDVVSMSTPRSGGQETDREIIDCQGPASGECSGLLMAVATVVVVPVDKLVE